MGLGWVEYIYCVVCGCPIGPLDHKDILKIEKSSNDDTNEFKILGTTSRRDQYTELDVWNAYNADVLSRSDVGWLSHFKALGTGVEKRV